MFLLQKIVHCIEITSKIHIYHGVKPGTSDIPPEV